MAYKEENAPWPVPPECAVDRVLSCGNRLVAGPLVAPPLAQDDTGPEWSWLLLRMDAPDSPDETHRASEAMSVKKVISTVGDEHVDFVYAETRSAIDWLRQAAEGWRRSANDAARTELTDVADTPDTADEADEAEAEDAANAAGFAATADLADAAAERLQGELEDAGLSA